MASVRGSTNKSRSSDRHCSSAEFRSNIFLDLSSAGPEQTKNGVENV